MFSCGKWYYKLLYSWQFWLGAVTVLAIVVRSIPAWTNAAWGCDLGIYYGLAKIFVKQKMLFPIYTGWGDSYQYFPVLYVITGVIHTFTGVDLLSLVSKIGPIVGGLTVPIFYFIVYELLKDRRVALIASALLSVATFHVYQTSHTAPLTFGHFFMMLSIYLFIKFVYDRRSYLFPLLLSTVLLILSHHFTTYFYIIVITAMFFTILFFKRVVERKDVYILLYVSLSSALAFSYWTFVAKPVSTSFITSNFILPLCSTGVITLYYLILYGVFLFTFLYHGKTSFGRILDGFKPLPLGVKFVIIFFIILTASFIVSVTGVPGVHAKLTIPAIMYSIPMIFLVSLSLSNLSVLRQQQGGRLVLGWVFGIAVSLFYSLVSGKLFPDRHLEYLIVPLCVPAAMAILKIADVLSKSGLKEFFVESRDMVESKLVYKRHISVALLLLILIFSNGASTYQTINELKFIDERIADPCVNMLKWMHGNISYSSVVASDHRISMLLWAEGFNITYGETNTTWTSVNWSGCISELCSLNVSYVVIDDIMRDVVVNVDVGKYYHMTNESYLKFQREPFELVYRNATFDSLGEEIHWVEIYRVNWSAVSLLSE